MDASLKPLLIDVAERIETGRLILRCPQPGDGAIVNAGGLRFARRLAPLHAVGANRADAG